MEKGRFMKVMLVVIAALLAVNILVTYAGSASTNKFEYKFIDNNHEWNSDGWATDINTMEKNGWSYVAPVSSQPNGFVFRRVVLTTSL